MNRATLLMFGLLFVTGCNRGPQVNEKNASVEEVAAKVAAATDSGGFVRAGEWQSKTTLDEFTMPGMPPEALSQMRAAMDRSQSNNFKSCLTDADVKKPNGKFFTGKSECRYDHFTMGGGKIDAEMTCPGGQGMSQNMTMQGNYTPTSYDMHLTMIGNGGAPDEKMTMKMHVVSNRIGECEKPVAADGSPPAKG